MREVKSGHYVEVEPTPLPKPHYVIHSRRFFNELNLPESLAREEAFMQFFTGNPTVAVDSANAGIETQRIRTSGWASGYALSIYGQEMVQNCPFKTGNGYGDGRAISVLEVLLAKDQRWEFQLKGGGTTPYCRGGDGRAILRSSIREFLVSEAMAELGVPTTRALCLYVSQSETISRPWYSPNAKTQDPDRMVNEPAAITTRVAPSFLRVGQLELFGRRAKKTNTPTPLPSSKPFSCMCSNENILTSPHNSAKPQQHLAKKSWPSRGNLPCASRNWLRTGYAWAIARATSTATTAP